MRSVPILMMMGVLFTAAGCGDSVTVYEPGVYKGETDPLLEKQASAEHQGRLRERFETVQTDR